MHALLKRRFAVKKTVICIFGLGIFSLLLKNEINPHVINPKHTLNMIGNISQSHQYNIISLTEEPACAVRIIDNLSSSGLKEIQDERKSHVKKVCDMCQRNRTSIECNHVVLDEDYHRDREDFYGNLVVNDKHKVGSFS